MKGLANYRKLVSKGSEVDVAAASAGHTSSVELYKSKSVSSRNFTTTGGISSRGQCAKMSFFKMPRSKGVSSSVTSCVAPSIPSW